jgi:hypothetical protein
LNLKRFSHLLSWESLIWILEKQQAYILMNTILDFRILFIEISYCLLTSALNTNQDNLIEDWQEKFQELSQQDQAYGYCSI